MFALSIEALVGSACGFELAAQIVDSFEALAQHQFEARNRPLFGFQLAPQADDGRAQLVVFSFERGELAELPGHRATHGRGHGRRKI